MHPLIDNECINTITQSPTNNIKELNYRYIFFTLLSLMLDDQIETRVFLS